MKNLFHISGEFVIENTFHSIDRLVVFSNRGNIPGEKPYETGDPCSQCASGSGNCEDGLCSKYGGCLDMIFISHLIFSFPASAD